ncbi:hypothetical protein BFP97_07015 [Roseivirga sp. 4D4]|nr:hypothetical protein BFP97_07015 [Roseivirga sp. 4D4]
MCCCLSTLNAQHNFDFVYSFEQGGNTPILIDGPQNRTYVLLQPSGSVTLDPKNGFLRTSRPTNYPGSVFYAIGIYNDDGSYYRGFIIDVEAGSDRIKMDVADNGDIYIFSAFKDQALLDQSNPTTRTIDESGKAGFFIARYSGQTGALINHMHSAYASSTQIVEGQNIKVLPNGQIAVTGNLTDQIDMSFGNNTGVFGTNGSIETFVGLYNADLSYDKGFTFGGQGVLNAIDVTSTNDVVVVGYVANNATIDIDPAAGQISLTNANRNRNFLAKYDANLDYQAHIDFGEGNVSASRFVTIDEHDSIYFASNTAWEGIMDNTRDRLDLDNSSGTFDAVTAQNRGVFIGKYSKDLVFGGGTVLGGKEDMPVFFRELDVKNDKIYLNVAEYNASGPNQVDLSPRDKPTFLINKNFSVLMTMDRNFDVIGFDRIPGSYNRAAVIGSNGDIMYVGSTGNNNDVNSGSGVNTPGQSGMYIAKMSSCTGSITSNTPAVCFGDSYTIGNNAYTQEGTYLDVLEDQNGCDSLVVTSLFFPSSPVTPVITSFTDITCNGASDGTITLNITGGIAPYEVSGDGVQFFPFPDNNLLTNVPPINNQPLIIRDANGCITNTAPVTIQEPSALSFNPATISAPTCTNGNDGSIVISVQGGTAPYSYSLDGVTYQPNDTFSGVLSSGDQIIYVQDANGCEISETVTIPDALPLDATITTTATTSCGVVDGTITISSPVNGQAPYEFSIDGGTTFQATTLFSGLSAGIYTITIKDNNGCTNDVQTTITEPSAITATTTFIDPLCNGSADGSITVATVGGGVAPYEYSINGGTFQTGSTFNGLSGGTYIITVKDATNCTFSITNTLIEPSPLTLVATVTSDVICNGGDNGVVTLTAGGGTGVYQYEIIGQAVTTNNIFTELSAGNYIFMVTDVNGCTTSVQTTVGEPTQIVLSASITKSLACNGDTNGEVSATASGGTGPYTFSIDGMNYQNGSTFDNLSADSYTITVRDGNNCEQSTTIQLTEPLAISVQTTVNNVTCFGGSDGIIDVSASGGTGGLTYSIDGTTFNSSDNFSNLAAGSYTISVQDALGCTTTISATVAEPTAIMLNFEAVDVTCNGEADGQIAGFTSGGTAPYQYSLDGTNFQAGPFADLAPGNYTLTVIDANNCTTTQTVTITEPDILMASITNIVDATCNGADNGSAGISVTGGSTPYSYSINSGAFNTSVDLTGLSPANYSIIIKDANDCETIANFTITEPTAISGTAMTTAVLCNGGSDGTITVTASGGTGTLIYSINGTDFQPSNIFSGLSSGNYTVSIKDDNSCISTLSANVAEPTPIQVNASVTDLTCNGNGSGEIDITATGGTGAYEYSIDGTIFQNTETFSGLQAGTYTVVVRDVNSCTVTTSITITEPSVLGAGFNNISHISCNGANDGSAQIDVTGGTAPFTYSVNGGSFSSSIDLNNLSPGGYAVVVRDANNCEANASFTILQRPPLTATVTSTQLVCNGDSDGSITVTATGGTGDLSYSLNGSTFQPSSNFTGLSAGNYTVTIKDENGCEFIVNTDITQPAAIQVSTTVTNLTCNGDNTGAVDLTASGGTGALTYSIDGTNFQSETSFSGLAAGNYTLVVKDDSDCTLASNLTITEPDVLMVSAVIVDDNTISATATGGTGPYEYSIDGTNFQGSGTFSGLTNGNYNVTVRDANQCMASISQTLIVTSFDKTGHSVSVKTYPNPTQGELIITGLSTGDKISLMNVNGLKLIQDRKVQKDGDLTLDISELPNGIILIRVQDKAGIIKGVRKVIKKT